MASKEKKTEEPDFEQSLKRLETIVEDMETGSLSLEDMMNRFEEGTGLVKFCTEKLDEVEQKIEKLVKKGDQIATEPFEATDE